MRRAQIARLAEVRAERGTAYEQLEERYLSAFTLREQAASAAADAGRGSASAQGAMDAFLAG